MDAAPADMPQTASPRRTHVAHAWLTAPVHRELTSEAMRRREHPDALAAKILDAVILNGLVDAILNR